MFLVIYGWYAYLITVIEAVISQTRHRRRNVNGGEGRTVSEADISQTRHGRRNVNGGEGRTAREAATSQTRHGRRNDSRFTSLNHYVS